jgi:hypothetical protein
MDDTTCRLSTCSAARKPRSAFCSLAHRLEYRRISERDRKRRERGWTETLDEPKIPQSGRSVPRSPDSWTPPTEHAPGRKYARRPVEPELVDYTQPGATNRPSVLESRPVPTGQRYRAPSVEADSWTPDDDTSYYDSIDWRARNTMTDGPYSGGYQSAGTPVAFQVVVRGSQ